MKRLTASLAVVLALGVAGTGAAEAKGCIKGAMVGAVAGHFMHHHAVLGAIGGCVVGRHLANEHEREAREREARERAAAHDRPDSDSGHGATSGY